jgi:hypothetical protein
VNACKLCQHERELQDSHFMPKALYKRARDDSRPNPHPLLFSATGERQTSRQARQYLLCRDCEQLFHHGGEDWVLEHSATTATQFPLRDILLSVPAAHRRKLGGGVDYFSNIDIPAVDADVLGYFALSIIWRATFPGWKIDDVSISPLRLGPYQETLRRYLVGETGLPEDLTVIVIVSSVPEVDLTVNMPQTKREVEYHCHHFDIPGLSFMVDIGARIPVNLREMCLLRGKGRPLFYTDAAQRQNQLDYMRLRELRTWGRPSSTTT